ncbi:MAG: TonB-dependent receptor [Alphaproteobacteria bacterium]|nr:TonB-dependent receptor [Alphaproteobacteria bacterium]
MRARTRLLICVCASAVLGGGAANAAVDEIRVTAQKREQALSEVPLAVQAITGEELEQIGARQISDVVDFIPGASSVSQTAPGFETIQIRGISSGTTADATVGYYVDEVPFSVPNLQLAPPSRLYDLERVEVLRGPQGTLFGQGSMGGTIRVITAQPDLQDFRVRGRAELSDTEGGDLNHSVEGVVNLPIVRDRLALRVSGGMELLSGYAESPDFPGEDNLNESESWNVRGKLLFRPTESVDITLSAWLIDNDTDFFNTLQSVDPPRIERTSGVRSFIRTPVEFYSGVIDWDLGWASLVSATSYIDHELDFVAGVPSGFFDVVNDSLFHTTSFAQEVRLVSDDAGALDWIGGVYYRKAKIESDIVFDITGFGTFIDDIGEIDTKSWAAFGEVSYELFGGTVVPLVGLRYFEDDRSGSGYSRLTTLSTQSENVFETLNPRFNLSIRPHDDVLIFGNVAKGFRSGAVQTQAQATAASLFLGIPVSTAIAPDELWSYELGTKLRLLGGSLRLDASVYYNDWSDIQTQFTAGASVALANSGEAHSLGLDLALLWETPLDGLTLQFAGNINESEFDEVDPALAATTALAEGGPIPNVPESNFTLSANFVRPLPNTSMDGFAYAAYAYRADQMDAASGLRSDALNDVSLRIGLEGDRWRATLFGENLFNEDDVVVRSADAAQILYPRRIGVSLEVDFQ